MICDTTCVHTPIYTMVIILKLDQYRLVIKLREKSHSVSVCGTCTCAQAGDTFCIISFKICQRIMRHFLEKRWFKENCGLGV